MKQKTFLTCKVGEYAVIFNKKQQALLLLLPRNGRYPKEMWHLPGGRLFRGDKAQDALRREVREETGLGIEVIAPCHVERAGYSKPEKYCVFFLCKAKSGSKIRLSKEHIKYQWADIKNLKKISWYRSATRRAIEKAWKLRVRKKL